MNFSDRIERLPPFLFSDLRIKIRKMKDSGIDVISLGAGAFSKKETNSRTKKYLKSVNILLSIIAVVGVILVLFL